MGNSSSPKSRNLWERNERTIWHEAFTRTQSQYRYSNGELATKIFSFSYHYVVSLFRLQKNHALPPSPQDAHAQQVQDPKVQSHGVTSHPGRYNLRVGTDAEEITEVDMSNESILSMIIANWNLHPSYINLPVQTSNAMITNDDLLELLSFLIPVETCWCM